MTGVDQARLIRYAVIGLGSETFKVSGKLRVGSLWISGAGRFRLDTYPFGGVGVCGFGREGVRCTMEELSQWKFMGMRL